jgi:hypothetical protein
MGKIDDPEIQNAIADALAQFKAMIAEDPDGKYNRCVVCGREPIAVSVFVPKDIEQSTQMLCAPEGKFRIAAYACCKEHFKDHISCESALEWEFHHGDIYDFMRESDLN